MGGVGGGMNGVCDRAEVMVRVRWGGGVGGWGQEGIGAGGGVD